MQEVSTKKLLHLIDQHVTILLIIEGFTFANYLDTNEKSSKQRAVKGIVSSKLNEL